MKSCRLLCNCLESSSLQSSSMCLRHFVNSDWWVYFSFSKCNYSKNICPLLHNGSFWCDLWLENSTVPNGEHRKYHCRLADYYNIESTNLYASPYEFHSYRKSTCSTTMTTTWDHYHFDLELIQPQDDEDRMHIVLYIPLHNVTLFELRRRYFVRELQNNSTKRPERWVTQKCESGEDTNVRLFKTWSNNSENDSVLFSEYAASG